ncbi:nitroreductase family protein [Acetivibrio sp. MSJd-27]|jgi:nitroreductase|uniref:nitroreductase family protein n=1 Tax=Acetivibrio sp. MSJd-27 TaxID=2841523 RepID=UPI001C103D69|nr:nitroreductase family protein [Acetivibrio sp. MSJd-27]MBU5449010.1 nitroreductase family protein [Acetivibrio sp. MSJd-27]
MKEIFKRASIRKYSGKPVEKEKTKQLLRAAMAAPSARNKKPWHFIVIREREMLEKIAAFHPYASMLTGADCAILICGDYRLEDQLGYLAINGAAATENMLLEAVSLGLGACWLGIYPRQERMKAISELTGLPDYIVPLTLVSVGYPAEEKVQEERFDEDRIRYDRW